MNRAAVLALSMVPIFGLPMICKSINPDVPENVQKITIVPPKESVPVATSPVIEGYDAAKVFASLHDELGVFKTPGSDGDRVRKYCTETYNNDDVYSADGWCSAFVCYKLKQNGYMYSPNNTDFGWNFVIQRIELKDAKPGDIVMMDSHISFFIEEFVNADGKDVVGIRGGNQDYQVCDMWVPKEDIEYCAVAFKAPPGWVPQKHIPNGTSTGGINVLNDNAYRWASPAVKHTAAGHPL